jgi:hypothetical protein
MNFILTTLVVILQRQVLFIKHFLKNLLNNGVKKAFWLKKRLFFISQLCYRMQSLTSAIWSGFDK